MCLTVHPNPDRFQGHPVPRAQARSPRQVDLLVHRQEAGEEGAGHRGEDPTSNAPLPRNKFLL